jgi:hypothetical protein
MKGVINELSMAGYRELGELTARFSSGDGIHPTAIAGLHCIRLSERLRQLPVVYKPCVCVIVQGAKRTMLEDEIYAYAPPQFLAVSVDLPLTSQVLEASADAPYLCIVVDIDARLLAQQLPVNEPPPVSARFRCDQCGVASVTWHWRCPSCRSWDSLQSLGNRGA